MIPPTKANHYLWGILALGLILRLSTLPILWNKPLTIVDEKHYQTIAENILKHGEFSLQLGTPTAIRPPLYPGFLAFMYSLTGGVNYNTIRLIQSFLSLLIVYMAYLLAMRLFGRPTALTAACLIAIYPSFVCFTHLLLTEVLFSLLLISFLYFYIMSLKQFSANSEKPFPTWKSRTKWQYIFLAGIFLGLGALTRSILYPFLPVAIAYFVFVLYRSNGWNSMRGALLLLIGTTIVIAPWSMRNAQLFNQFVPVGTMGGLNLFMGNYSNTPLFRSWAAIDLPPEKAWYRGNEIVLSSMNEAEKQKWAVRQAKQFMIDNKTLTIKRSLIKAAQFWGLERSVLASFIHGHWPEYKKLGSIVVLAFFIFGMYSLVVIGAIFGFFMNIELNKVELTYILVVLVYFTGMHAVVFGHSRYHLPLIPILCILAAWSIVNYRQMLLQVSCIKFRMAGLSALIMVFFWCFELIIVEGRRFLSLIG